MSISHALKALNIRGYILRGEPSSEAEFEKMFVKVTGVDSKNNAVESSNPKDFGVTWSEVAAKKKELDAAEPMKKLREQRDIKLTETDWWASSDLTMSDERKKYRQDLRDITKSATSLDDVKWPTKPE